MIFYISQIKWNKVRISFIYKETVFQNFKTTTLYIPKHCLNFPQDFLGTRFPGSTTLCRSGFKKMWTILTNLNLILVSHGSIREIIPYKQGLIEVPGFELDELDKMLDSLCTSWSCLPFLYLTCSIHSGMSCILKY